MRQLIYLISICLIVSCNSGRQPDTRRDTANVQVTGQMGAAPVSDDLSEQAAPSKDTLVKEFISCFNPVDVARIAEKVAYPLDRSYPLSDIQNEQELQTCFKEVFDDKLIRMIVTSNPDSDWSDMDYRGLMLLDGLVWLNDKGKFTGANYSTKAAQKKKLQLIKEEKDSLHPTLRVFTEPVLVMKTADFTVRIDKTSEDYYRYAAWKRDIPMSQKPDLIIQNGTKEFEGSGGNHSYIFKKGTYTYTCGIQILGEEDIPGDLTITQNGKEIFYQAMQELNY